MMQHSILNYWFLCTRGNKKKDWDDHVFNIQQPFDYKELWKEKNNEEKTEYCALTMESASAWKKY